MTLSPSARIVRACRLRSLLDSGLTLAEAGAKFGISKQRVSVIVGGAKRHHRWKTPMRQIAKPHQAEIAGLLLAGESIVSVARKFGVSVYTIGRLSREVIAVSPIPKKQIHGTLSCYRSGCRCAPCKKSNREHRRKTYANKLAKQGKQVRVYAERRKESK